MKKVKIEVMKDRDLLWSKGVLGSESTERIRERRHGCLENKIVGHGRLVQYPLVPVEVFKMATKDGSEMIEGYE